MGRRERTICLGIGVALFAIAGATAGVTTLFTKKHAEPNTATKKAEPRAETANETSGDLGMSKAELKERIRRLHPGMDVDKELAEAEAAVIVTELPIAERKRRMEQGIAGHFREAWDGSWGSATENRLTTEFANLGYESGFDVARVQCRTSTCIVTVQWQGHDLAEAAYESIVSKPVGIGCRLEMLPPSSGAREAPIFLDCSKERKASAESVPMVATITGAIPTRDDD